MSKFNLISILTLKTVFVKDSEKAPFYAVDTYFQQAQTTERNVGFTRAISKLCQLQNLTIGKPKFIFRNHIIYRLGDIAEYENGMIIIAGWDGEGTTEFLNSTTAGMRHKL